jgi:integrase
VRAAFGAALQASSDPTVHPDLHGFELSGNPAAAVPAKPLARFNTARERTLNATELRAFMDVIGMAECLGIPPSTAHAKDAPPVVSALNRDVLCLCLLLGGQRLAQLVRLKPAHVDRDESSIVLFDAKGARKQPRSHYLPLTERAMTIVDRHLKRAEGESEEELPYLFTNNGRVPVRVETLSGVVNEASGYLVRHKRVREPFQMRDIRRTCETALAAAGVSKDIRAQILSHGLGGVQDRHYDRHQYMDEKRRALEMWDARLVEIASGAQRDNVLPLKRRP